MYVHATAHIFAAYPGKILAQPILSSPHPPPPAPHRETITLVLFIHTNIHTYTHETVGGRFLVIFGDYLQWGHFMPLKLGDRQL